MTIRTIQQPSVGTLLATPMPNLADYVTTQDAAAQLGFHIITVRQMLRAGKLTGLKVGTMWFVQKKSLERYLKDNAGMDKHDPRRGRK